ncbi:ATP-dependent RNA helicase A protein [Caerostris extrusa]|uniref:ATP-dependent RNA helicase A protein n=1 Tax=Caerostris extrusa TaxID=172846 RepID=A0AAV4XPY5_CAEEX|nr:ATP-dependent RNA helicase A protein [Caerostris extrusa]
MLLSPEVPIELPAGFQTEKQEPADLPEGGPLAPHIHGLRIRKKMEEAEDLDVNSAIHGNWTLDNAKSRLHQFLQASKLNQDYKYSVVGPDHNRSYLCEMNVYVRQLGRSM